MKDVSFKKKLVLVISLKEQTFSTKMLKYMSHDHSVNIC